MPIPPDAVLLDLDGTLSDTLVSLRAGTSAATRLAVAETGVDPQRWAEANEAAVHEIWPARYDAWATGAYPTAELSTEVYARTLESLGLPPDTAPRLAGAHTAAASSTGRSYPDALPLLRALAGRGIRTAILTNGAGDVQRATLRAAGLDGTTDAVVVSGEHGVMKPDPRLFEIALAELDVPAHRAWHVGDSLAADVAGALAAGVTAVWIDRDGRGVGAEDPVPHRVVRSLNEVEGLLDAG